MTIFDFLGPAYPDIKTITEAEAVRIVGDALGVEFTYSEFFNEWVARKGKTRLNLKYSNFNLPDNHDLFLGAGYAYRTGGGGRPCDSIKEAIAYLERKVEEVKNDRT
jgi:hypothetical protein